MVDITKCPGKGEINGTPVICDKREQCYRYTSPSDKYQSWFNGLPIDEDGVCEAFWSNKKEKP